MKPTLDLLEALSGPLYLVAFVLIANPVVDFVLSVPPMDFSSAEWRFAAVGLLSGFSLTLILGFSLALVVASLLEHHGMQRMLVVLCLTIGIAMLVMCIGFVFDALQLRVRTPADGREAYDSAWHRAIIKHVLSGLALIYLGWRARRTIPVPSSRRGPKPVHVVTK